LAAVCVALGEPRGSRKIGTVAIGGCYVIAIIKAPSHDHYDSALIRKMVPIAHYFGIFCQLGAPLVRITFSAPSVAAFRNVSYAFMMSFRKTMSHEFFRLQFAGAHDLQQHRCGERIH
jgi:hypothetical protein